MKNKRMKELIELMKIEKDQEKMEQLISEYVKVVLVSEKTIELKEQMEFLNFYDEVANELEKK